MSEFWIISNFLREKCDENIQTHELCKQIAAKYIEGERKEWRAQTALEENISLKLDVGNLESICHTMIENDEAQTKLHSLLKECYEEHLKLTFDMDESEIDRLFSYEEIKIELDTRETIGMYQQLYWRKMEMATKMEERKIVKRYRRTEQELCRTRDERLKLEETINNLKEKAKEAKMKKRDLLECIYRLVKGSKDLENIYCRQKHSRAGIRNENLKRADKTRLFGSVEKTKATDKIPHKGGLSSRLLLDFNQFRIPFVPALPKIRKIDPSKGLSRLLQQAEVLRKSIQANVPDNLSTPRLVGILKKPNESVKALNSSPKILSFNMNTVQDPDITQSIPKVSLDSNISEITVDSELKKNLFENTKTEPSKEKIEIIENIIIKPADTLLPFQLPAQLPTEDNTKLPIDPKSPPKNNHKDTDNSIELGSKSFMDMFLDFSNETPTTSLSIVETTKKSSQDVDIKLEQRSKGAKPEEKRDEKKAATKRKVVDEDHSYVAKSPPKKNHKDTDNSIEFDSKSFMDMFLEVANDTPSTSLSIVQPTKKTKCNAKSEDKKDEKKAAMKRKVVDEDDSYVAKSPPKKNHKDTDNSIEFDSKGFMDMFLEVANETPTTSLSVVEPTKKSSQDIEIKLETKQPSKKSKFDAEPNEKKDEKKSAKKPRASFDDFEDFFSDFAANANENNDTDQSAADMSFDFFDGTANLDDPESDNFSLKF